MFKAHLLEQRNHDVLFIEAFEWNILDLQNKKAFENHYELMVNITLDDSL